jgi:hypothetical protein
MRPTRQHTHFDSDIKYVGRILDIKYQMYLYFVGLGISDINIFIWVWVVHNFFCYVSSYMFESELEASLLANTFPFSPIIMEALFV